MTGHSFAATHECPVCGPGASCTHHPHPPHLASYPFLPGGIDPMAGKDYVTAPHKIVDHELGRIVYGTGERVPMADAVKYGLVASGAAGENGPKPPAPARGKRKGEDRAHRPGENTAKKPSGDR